MSALMKIKRSEQHAINVQRKAEKHAANVQKAQARKAAKAEKHAANVQKAQARKAAKAAKITPLVTRSTGLVDVQAAITAPGASSVIASPTVAVQSPVASYSAPAPSAYSSGYDPNEISRMFPGDETGNQPAPVPSTPTTSDPSTPSTPTTSDPVMREKLLHVKQTNPDYYAFIADQLRSSGINSTLEGTGGDGIQFSTGYAPATGGGIQFSTGYAPAASVAASTVSPKTDWSDTFKQVLTPAIQTWGQYLTAKVQNKQITQEQANQQMLNAQASNAYLRGDSGSAKMYIFSGLALLALAWFLLRKKR